MECTINYPVEVIEDEMEFIGNDVIISNVTERTILNSERELIKKSHDLALKDMDGKLKSYVVKGIFKGEITYSDKYYKYSQKK